MDLSPATREEAEQVGPEERPRVRNVVALLRVGETAREGAVSARPPADARFTRNFYNFHRVRTPLTSPAPGSHRPPRFAYTVFPRSGLVIATGIPHLDAVARSARVFRREYNSAGETAATTDDDDDDGEGEEEDSFFSARPRVVNTTFSGRVRSAGNVLLRLHQLRARGRLPEDVQVSFRSQCFPGARLRWRSPRGTVNLFRNGRYVMIGVVCPEAARLLHGRLSTLVRTPATAATIAPVTASA